ncbi:hypothetical protein Tco_1328068, partial [Tanacetum coccineum]
MDGVDIEDLTIDQYLELTQENHTPSVGIKVNDMTIAEYLEYEETIKTQDYNDYQPHSAKTEVLTRYRGHLCPRHKSPDPPLDAKTNPYFQASLSPIHPKITKTQSKHSWENEVIKEREQSDQGLELSLADPKNANIIVEMADKIRGILAEGKRNGEISSKVNPNIQDVFLEKDR